MAYDPDLSRRIAEEMFGSSAKPKPPTPLMEACASADEATALPLIAKSRSAGKPDAFGRTPLHEATRYAYRDPVAALKIVTALLEKGVEVDPVDDEGHTPLMEAAIYAYPEILRLLLAQGADPNRRMEDDQTIVGTLETTPSLKDRRKRIVKILLDAGGQR